VKFWTRLDLTWILLVLLTVVAVAPLTYPGFFEAHSGFLPAFANVGLFIRDVLLYRM